MAENLYKVVIHLPAADGFHNQSDLKVAENMAEAIRATVQEHGGYVGIQFNHKEQA